jgi:hypothetical protein
MYYVRWEIPGTMVHLQKFTNIYTENALEVKWSPSALGQRLLDFNRQFISWESLSVWAFHQLFVRVKK